MAKSLARSLRLLLQVAFALYFLFLLCQHTPRYFEASPPFRFAAESCAGDRLVRTGAFVSPFSRRGKLTAVRGGLCRRAASSQASAAAFLSVNRPRLLRLPPSKICAYHFFSLFFQVTPRYPLICQAGNDSSEEAL